MSADASIKGMEARAGAALFAIFGQRHGGSCATAERADSGGESGRGAQHGGGGDVGEAGGGDIVGVGEVLAFLQSQDPGRSADGKPMT